MFGNLRRKITVAAAAGFAVAGLAVGAAGTASAATTAPVHTARAASTIGCDDYTSGYCGSEQQKFGKLDLDVYQQKAVYGEKVVLWTKSSTDRAQDFIAKNYNGLSGTGGPDKTFEYAPNGIPSGLCLSFPSTARGTGGVLRTCNQSIYQTFSPIAMAGSYVAWQNLASTYVIEDGAFGNAGTQVDQWTYNGGDNQAYRFWN